MKYIKLFENYDASKRIGPFIFITPDEETFNGILYNIDIKFRLKIDDFDDRYIYFNPKKNNEEILNYLTFITLIFTFDGINTEIVNSPIGRNKVIRTKNLEINIPAFMEDGYIHIDEKNLYSDLLVPELKFINKEEADRFKQLAIPLILKFNSSYRFFKIFANYINSSMEWKKLIEILKNVKLS